MKNKKIYSFVQFLFSLVIFSSCMKEAEFPQGVTKTPLDLGLPLINSTLEFKDIQVSTDSSLRLEIDTDGSYVLKIGPVKYSFVEAREFIKFGDQGINLFNVATIPISNIVSRPPSTTLGVPIPLFSNTNTLLGTSKLNQIFFNQGDIEVELESRINTPVDILLEFENILDSVTNQPIRFDFALNSFGTSAIKKTLKSQKFKLDGINALQLKPTISFSRTSPIESGDIEIKKISIGNLNWSRLEAKLGTIALPIVQDTINALVLIKPFSNSSTSANVEDVIVYFQNPKMNIKFYNSFGLAASLYIDPFRAISKDGITSKNYLLDQINITKPSDPIAGVSSNFPSLSNYNVSQIVLRDVLKTGPKYLAYGLKMLVDGNATSDADFILPNSRIGTEASVELPLYGYLNNLVITSEIENPMADQDVGLDGTTSGVNYTDSEAEMRFYYENSMPIDVKAQVYFVDDYDRNIDSLFTSNSLLKGGQLDNSGKVVKPTIGPISKIRFNNTRAKNIQKNCTLVRIKTRFLTTGADAQRSIKLYPNNKINIRLSAFIKTNLSYNNE